MDELLTSIRKEWGDNRTLWNEIFTALKHHQDLCIDQYKRPQILRIQIDTLNCINRILTNTLDAYNDDKTPEPFRTHGWQLNPQR